MSNEIPKPAPVYLQLRDRILNIKPSEVGLGPSKTAPHVWGILMETGYQVGTATLVSLADGTTSLYYSTGGGMLGSGEYAPVADASKALVIQAESHLQHMVANNEFPLPEIGQVRFIILTYTGLLSVDAPEEVLVTGNHILSPLFMKAHDALEQLRLLAEKKQTERT